jgi:hypothetical protein
LVDLVILTAEELKALDSLERQASRRYARQQPLAQAVLRAFLRRGGPVPVDHVISALPGATTAALGTLDEEDLIRIRSGVIDIAYPFSAAPTPYVVRFRRGRERYACCATDALGIAPMTGERIDIITECHHCGEPMTISATPESVRPAAEGVMLWFGKRSDAGAKACDSL